MKKVLIISNSFPPYLDGGVFRPLKFTKYLPKCGWTPVILKSKTKLQKNFPRDESLCNDFPQNLKIYETFSLCKYLNMFQRKLNNEKDLLNVPDPHIGWLPFALVAGRKIILKEKIDMIFTTGPPHSTHLIGYLLKKVYGTPWVADFRDPWVQNVYIKPPTGVHAFLQKIMEHNVIKHADRIVTVTEPIKNDFIESYKSLIKDKILVIPNGYDPGDFVNLIPKKTDKCTFSYTGSLYLSISLDLFLKSVKDVITEKPDMMNKIKVIIAGSMNESHILGLINELGINNIVEYKGLVSYKASLDVMMNSDVLIVVSSSKGYTDQHTKTFQYMAAKKAILGMVPNGPAADVIKNFGDSIVVHPDDVDEIKNAIYTFYYIYSQGQLKGGDDLEVIEKYNRERLTLELAQLFNEILNKL